MFSDLLGTIKQSFAVGIRGVLLKNKSGTSAGSEVLQVRNATDAAFAAVEVGDVTANAVGAASVSTTGGVTVGNALTVSAGGANVTGAGTFSGALQGTGVTATTGNITATAGNISATAGSVAAGTTVTAGTNLVATSSVVVGSGANQATLSAPASGGATTLTLPVGGGASGYVLSTNGAGVLSWVDPGSPTTNAARWTAASTTIAFNSGATVAGDAIPSGSVIDNVQVIIDTPFDATGAALSVGITGTPTKYMATTDSALNFAAATVFAVHPGLPAEGSATAVSIAFTAGTGGTAGSARVIVTYAAPL